MMDRIFSFIEKFLKWLLHDVLGLCLSEERMGTLVEFVKFGIIGLSNTVISYVIYVIVLLFLQTINVMPKSDYLIAQFVGFVLSVLWSFYWNNKFVFNEKRENRNWMHALLKTYASYALTGLFLNSILSILWIEVLDWSKMVAPIINLLVSVPLNFILNKFWAFKSKKR